MAASSSSSSPDAAIAPSRSHAIATESLDDAPAAAAAAPSRAHATSFAASPGDDATTSTSGVSGTKLSSSSSSSSSPTVVTWLGGFGVGSASVIAAAARSLASFLRRQLLSLDGFTLASPMVASWGFGSPDPPLWSGSDSATTSASFSFIISPSPPRSFSFVFRLRLRLFLLLVPVPVLVPPLGSPGGSSAASAGAVFDDGDMNGLAVRITLATLEPLRITFATKPPTRRSITTAGDSLECVSGSHWESSGSGWLSCDCVPSTSQPRPESADPGRSKVFFPRRRLLPVVASSFSSSRLPSSMRLLFSLFLFLASGVLRSTRAASAAARLLLAIAAARDAPTADTGAPHSCRCEPCFAAARECRVSAPLGTNTLPWTRRCVMSASPTRSWNVLHARAPSSDFVAADAVTTSRSARLAMLAPPGVPRSGAGGSRRDGARLRRTP